MLANIFNNIVFDDDSIFKETEKAIYTNKNKLPAYMAYRLIELSESSYGGLKEQNIISASMFSASVKQMLLHLQRTEAFYKVTVDVSDVIKSVQGSALHEMYLVDEPARIFKEVLGYKISGGADYIRYNEELGVMELRDIKTTSVKQVKNLKDELEVYKHCSLADLKVKYPTIFKYNIQLSVYNWLYDLNIGVGNLDFVMMDWTNMHLSSIGAMIQTIQLPLYSAKETEEYVESIVSLITGYKKSGYLPDCTITETSGKPVPEFKLVKNLLKPRKVNGSDVYRTRSEAAIAQSIYPDTYIFEAKKPQKPFLCTEYCQYNGAIGVDGKLVCQQGYELKESN